MRIRAIPQVYRNVNRWGEILSTLSKYGLADWLSQFEFSFGKSWLKNRDGEALASMSRTVRIRLAMEELGPTFIKLGQVMSTRPDLVGVDVATELELLQTAVPADPPAVVCATIEEELGQPPQAIFAEFDEVPVASASIGQVHRATLNSGEVVAVKVQHAGIAQVVRVDLDILAGLAQIAERMPEWESYRPCAAMAEFQRALRRELDFDRELRNIEEFRRCLEGRQDVRIPRPFPEYSTDRILSMEWLEGPLLSDRDAIARSNVDPAIVAQRGAELFLEMIFQHGFYHADPHPGNLVLLPQNAVGLLDFGMVGRIDESLREDIEDMLASIVERDSEQLTNVVMRVGAAPADLDEKLLAMDLADFTAHYAHQQADSFELAEALTEMLDLIRQYSIVLPSQISMLLKVFVMLEGSGRRLSPQFSLMEVLQPYRKKMIARRLSPARQLKKARRIAHELEQLAEVLPSRIRDILQQVQTGRFDVHLDHRGLEPSVNRLVLGLLTSALFLGSVSLITNEVWPIRGVSTPGVLGMALSMGLGLRLLRAISKSGHLDRRR